MEKDYWLHKKLEDMSHEEWEALCDGCSKCCLFKLREPGVPGVRFTNVVCRYMDMETCRCTDYEHRHENVPECILLTLSWFIISTGCPKPAPTTSYPKAKTCPGGIR